MHRTFGLPLCVVAALLVWIGSTSDVQAQSFQGGVRGAVRDAQGVVPGASVTLTNEATKVARDTTTNDVGEYTFPNVVPGTYTVTVAMTGYKTFERAGLTVATQQFVTLDTVLEVGAIEESITVTGASPLIDTSTASQGTVLDRAQLEALPTPGRNASLMAVTMPTVVSSGNTGFNRQNAQSGATTVSIGGGGVRANNYILDGVPVTDLTNRSAVFVSIEGLEEMKVQVHTYDAEMGRTGGGVFNSTAKSGTNDFHGSAFYRTQPTALLQQNFFLRGQPKADQYSRIPGYGVGGPIKKDRTFFWTSMEGDRGLLGHNYSVNFPTTRERAGDFSQTFDRNGRLIVIYDPLTTRTNPATGQQIRDPFPGNIVPADRINPVGQRIANIMPKPTNELSNQSPNYFNDNPTKDEALQWSAKMDHKFTNNLSLSALYVWARTGEDGDCWYDSNLFACPMFRLDRKVHVVGLNNNYVLNDSTVLALRFGWNRFDDSNSLPHAFDPATLGFNQAYLGAMPGKKFPRVDLDDFGTMGHSPRNDRYFSSYAANAALSKLRGRHSLKFGGEYRRIGVHGLAYGEESGNFTFNRQFSQGPNPLSPAAASGSSIADLLLGYPSAGSIAITQPFDMFVNYYGGYAQDDIRVSSKLAVNVGLRVEHEDGIREENDRVTVAFDQNAISPLNNLAKIPGRDAIRGGLVYAGVNGATSEQGNQPAIKMAPRAGVVYSINNNTVIRGGYGLFWAPWNYPSPNNTNYGQLGFTGVSTLQQNTLLPITSLDNPFPGGLTQPAGSSLGLLAGVGGTIDFVDQNKQASRVQQYSVDFQRELPSDVAVSVGYSGARGDFLSFGGTSDATININQLDPSYFSLGSQLVQLVPNPFFGVPGAGALATQATIQRGQLLRPFPQFLNVLAHQVSGGRSRYDALILELNKRVTGWWGGRVSYTRSRLMDNQFGQSNYYAATGVILNNYDVDREYSYGLIDVPNKIVVAPIFMLPFGAGKRFLDREGLFDHLVGGWTISMVVSHESGFPVAIQQSPNNAGLFGSNQRPNRVAGAPGVATDDITEQLSNNTADNQYLNLAAWSQAPAFTFGNAPRTDPDVRTPPRNKIDIAFGKHIKTGGRTEGEFRVELLNATGIPQYQAIPATFGIGTFGQVRLLAGYMRVTALTFRFRF
jgi:trimeric autotransporter adhesin